MDEKMTEEEARKFLLGTGWWEEEEGFAINAEKIDPESGCEVFFVGKTLEEALGGYCRPVKWWCYIPSGGEQLFDDIWDAVEYEEENSSKE